MPRRTDLTTIMIVGAGPIIIGQAAEFDYSGTQAVKTLKAEGYRIVLVNSNPATIMTDPELADATYIEPVTPEFLKLIIEQERPDALLPTVGGQTGLNTCLTLAESGVLAEYGVELIGASPAAIKLAEDRALFKEAMEAVGLACPRGEMVSSIEEALRVADEIGRYPLLIRPSYTLGGSGGGIASNREDLILRTEWGLKESPTHTVLIEESVLGWKEYELEVMRDKADNFVVICSIENLDPMGVHTGDSITVAPAMTLTDREYQRMRDQARTVIQTVGVETGGSNVQFAVNPIDGTILVIEMNPRVSRSSALASKATGFPIAKIAALLAVGYTLDEIPNDITRTTMAAFEPSIDYVVTKFPRWAFEKFKSVDPTLGPQMKSVGEAMAIGRTFRESFVKGLASLELTRPPYPHPDYQAWDGTLESLRTPTDNRIWAIWEALQSGLAPDAVAAAAHIDPWFTDQLGSIAALETQIAAYSNPEDLPHALLKQAKQTGFSDRHIAFLLSKGQPADTVSDDLIRHTRHRLGILPTYHNVDTCAAEFESFTPYLYSSYETESEAAPTNREKVIILGGGPNRIGQGIEFDYCCVHAAQTIREAGYEAVMINCNPETVSTDYDTSDRLYFEPLTLEHVLNVIEREQPLKGVIAQFGGQTPLNLIAGLHAAGIPILGTQPEAINQAEDRGAFDALLTSLDIPRPANGSAHSPDEAHTIAKRVGYPVLVRPSYVLGGRAMAIVDTEDLLDDVVQTAFRAAPGQSVLIDHYIEDAYEIDVDAVSDGEQVVIGGIMEHIEEAGVHSGDSACVIPPYKISPFHISHIREYTQAIGKAMHVRGLMNIQFAVLDDTAYVLEVNPRASRTIPYVSKATGVPLAKIATRAMLGETLPEIGFVAEPHVEGFYVKEAAMPFKKFLGVDARLGPEMRSTGEVMGHAAGFGHAFAKSQIAVGDSLPTEGTILFSVNDTDKPAALNLANSFVRMGFALVATRGTAAYFSERGLEVTPVDKIDEGDVTIVDVMREGQVQLVINTPYGYQSREQSSRIRSVAMRYGVPLITTLSAARAALQGIIVMREKAFTVRSLQAGYESL